MLEHDYEPEPGLPQALPDDEQVLWQGSPDARSLALGTFHVRKLALYFAVLLALRIVFSLQDGFTLAASLASSAGLMVLAVIAIGLLTLYARLAARSTLFTVTNRRVIIRCGVALPVTVNLPYPRIHSADLRLRGDNSGDIALKTDPGSRVSWVLLWPYVKPWRWMRVRPVLRGIDAARDVAQLLGDALAGSVRAEREERLRAAAAMSTAAVIEPDAAEPKKRRKREWQPYPTVPLAAAVSLVVLTVVGVTVVQLAGLETGPAARVDTQVVASVDLFFEDRDDGAVIVRNANDGSQIDVLEAGSNGFLRSTMRTFVRARKAIDAGSELPFRLRQTAGGQLLLSDPATAHEVDLWAFGKTNAAAFSRFLRDETGGQPAPAIELAEFDELAQPTAAVMNDQEGRQ